MISKFIIPIIFPSTFNTLNFIDFFKMSVSVLLDIFFVSTVPISLQLGTRGLAYSSIASQGSVLIFTLVVCWRMLGIRRQDLVKNINILLKKLSDMRIRFKLGLNILQQLKKMQNIQLLKTQILVNQFFVEFLQLEIIGITKKMKNEQCLIGSKTTILNRKCYFCKLLVRDFQKVYFQKLIFFFNV